MSSILPESLGSFKVVGSTGELWNLYWLRWPLHLKIQSDAGVNKPSQLHFGSRSCQPTPLTSHVGMAYSRRTLMPRLEMYARLRSRIARVRIAWHWISS